MSSLLLFERTQNLADANAIMLELSEEFDNARTDNRLFTDLIELGLIYKRRGYVDVFFSIFHQLFQLNPKRERVSFLLADTYFHYGDMDYAQYFISYCNRRRASYRSTILEIKILMANEKYDVAKRMLSDIIRGFGDDNQKAEPYLLMARVIEATQGLLEAESYLKVLYEYFSQDKTIDMNQVRRNLVQIEFEKELFNLSQVEHLYQHPSLSMDSEDYLLLTYAYKKAYQNEQAFRSAQKAIELDKHNIDARLMMAELGLELGYYSHIPQEVKWLVQNLPYGDLHLYDLVLLADEANELDDQLIEKALDLLELDLDNDQVLKLLQIIVKYYLKQHRAAQALAFLNNVAVEFAAPEYLSYLYAIIYRELGDEAQAIAYYYDALELSLECDTILEEVIALHKRRKEFKQAVAIALQYQMSLYYTDKVSKQIESIPNHYKK